MTELNEVLDHLDASFRLAHSTEDTDDVASEFLVASVARNGTGDPVRYYIERKLLMVNLLPCCGPDTSRM